MPQPSSTAPRMADRIAAHDWSRTPLGPMQAWPQSLKTAVDIMLGCGHAMQLAWGPERTILYNDAYAPMLGSRHPDALGLPFERAWPDVWDDIAALVDRVFAGETVRFEDLPLVMTRHGYNEDTWWSFSYSPVHDEAGHVAGLLNVPVDVTARVRAERAERQRDETGAQLRTIAERMRALLDASSDVVYAMSPDWTEMRTLKGRGFIADTTAPSTQWTDDYLLPEDRAIILAAIQQSIANTSAFELEHRVQRADGSLGWTFSRAVPVLGEDGRVTEWFGMAADVTERRESQARLQMLVDELQHRTRNLMSVVRSMAHWTGENSDGIADFLVRFGARIDALARAQGLLSRLVEHDRVTFDELLEAELAALQGTAGAVVLDGPRGIRLRSTTVQTLALAIHELSTNALKYGALGQPQAELTVRWHLEPADASGRPWLHLDWRERGVTMPIDTDTLRAAGQGRTLIESALPYQFGAKTRFALLADGVHCTIAMPVSASSVVPAPAGQ